MSQIPIIGIVGGIGSGKSTIARSFADLGCAVIDADAIVHEVLNEPDILIALKQHWGTDTLNGAGRADRRKIADKVFGSPEELDFLNGLLHPRVLERSEAMLRTYKSNLEVRGIVLDMPLLLEVGWEEKCDFLIFVDCDKEERCRRIAKKAKIDIEQIKIRENLQISLDKKQEKAHYRIDNNSDKSDVTEQIALIFSSMTGSN